MGAFRTHFSHTIALGTLVIPLLAPDGVPGMYFVNLGVDLGQLWEAYGLLLTLFWVPLAHLLAHVSGVLFMDAF